MLIRLEERISHKHQVSGESLANEPVKAFLMQLWDGAWWCGVWTGMAGTGIEKSTSTTRNIKKLTTSIRINPIRSSKHFCKSTAISPSYASPTDLPLGHGIIWDQQCPGTAKPSIHFQFNQALTLKWIKCLPLFRTTTNRTSIASPTKTSHNIPTNWEKCQLLQFGICEERLCCKLHRDRKCSQQQKPKHNMQ